MTGIWRRFGMTGTNDIGKKSTSQHEARQSKNGHDNSRVSFDLTYRCCLYSRSLPSLL